MVPVGDEEELWTCVPKEKTNKEGKVTEKFYECNIKESKGGFWSWVGAQTRQVGSAISGGRLGSIRISEQDKKDVCGKLSKKRTGEEEAGLTGVFESFSALLGE